MFTLKLFVLVVIRSERLLVLFRFRLQKFALLNGVPSERNWSEVMPGKMDIFGPQIFGIILKLNLNHS